MLSGGGARGAFQAGVWKVLYEHPRGFQRQPPEVISGTSAGALNGALICAGLTPDDILSFWLELADDPPITANPAFFRALERGLAGLALSEPWRAFESRARGFKIALRQIGKHGLLRRSHMAAGTLEYLFTARFDAVSRVLDSIDTAHIFDMRPLADRLRRIIGGNIVPKSKVRLAINTVDAATGSVVRIVNHPVVKSPRASAHHYRYHEHITIDMLLASSAIPLLFNPVEVDGRQLWDGGLLVNSPMAPAVALGAKRLLPVLVTSRGEHNVRTIGQAMERLVDTFLENAYKTDRKLLLDRNALSQRGLSELAQVELFEPIRPTHGSLFGAGSYLYFERNVMLAMFDAGRNAALSWLDRGPLRESGQDSALAPDRPDDDGPWAPGQPASGPRQPR